MFPHFTDDFFAGELCGRSGCAVAVYVILKGYHSVYWELLGKLISQLCIELHFIIAVSWCRLAILQSKQSLEKACLSPAFANGAGLDVLP